MLRPPLCSTLFPYTTLFRSLAGGRDGGRGGARRRRAQKTGTAGRGADAEPGSAASRRRAWRLGSGRVGSAARSEEHTSELQSRRDLVCRLLLEKKKKTN